MILDTEVIRRGTRVAIPKDDSYIYRLGVSLYGFSSINSFMIEVICHIDPSESRVTLHELTSGNVLDKFRQTVKQWTGADISGPANMAATEFERLNTERSDFVHAYPVTSHEGEQMLHRRVDRKDKYFYVTNDFLEDFIGRLTLVSTALYEIRAIVKPELLTELTSQLREGTSPPQENRTW